MTQATTAQQLEKVMRVSRVMEVILQIGQAFVGIGTAITLIALVFANSFQLNIGNGDLGITFFSQQQPAIVLNLYEASDRVGPNVDSGTPRTAQALRLETAPTAMMRGVTGVLLLLQVAVVMLVLEHLAKLFAQYAKGEIFTSAAVARIRKVGYTLLALPVISLLNSLFALVMTTTLPGGNGFDSAHLAFPMTGLFTGSMVLLISWIMDVGRALREENELTI